MSPVKTHWYQKAILLCGGCCIAWILLELVLQIGSFYIHKQIVSKGNSDILASNTFKILCIGESTTAPYKNISPWSQELEKLLSRTMNQKVKVVNAGVIGSNSFGLLSNFIDQLERYKPDLVISMIGINDDAKTEKWPGNLSIRRKWRLRSIQLFVHTYKEGRYHFYHFLSKFFKNSNSFQSSANDYKEMGIYYKFLGNWDLAENYLKRSIELNPLNLKTRTILIRVYEARGKIEEAKKIALEDLQQAPNYVHGFFNLGRIYLELNDYSNAKVYLEKAMKFDPGNDFYFYKLDELYRHIAKEDRMDYGQILGGINLPDDLQRHRIRWMRSRGNFDQAEDLARELLHKDINRIPEPLKHNYPILVKKTLEAGVPIILMQYPLRDLKILKTMFDFNEKHMFFIENKDNFLNALKRKSYEDLFIDAFAGDFGHTTDKGNQLIVENVIEFFKSHPSLLH